MVMNMVTYYINLTIIITKNSAVGDKFMDTEGRDGKVYMPTIIKHTHKKKTRTKFRHKATYSLPIKHLLPFFLEQGRQLKDIKQTATKKSPIRCANK